MSRDTTHTGAALTPIHGTRAARRNAVRATIALIAAALANAAPGSSTNAHAAGWRQHIVPLASERVRAEFVNWYGGTADAPGVDTYTFFASQLRVGARATYPRVQALVEFQNTRLAGLPNDASLPAPRGNLGPGAVYYAHTRESDQGETFLRQAFVAARWKGVQAALGRFEYADGLETTPGDPTLVWLKRARIAERLVGPYGYTHVGRVFDGARLSADRRAFNISAIAARPTAGGFEVSAGPQLGDVDLAGVSLTAKRLDVARPADMRVAYFFYEDRRGADGTPVRVDNRPAAVRAEDRGAIRIHTLAGHAIAAADIGAGRGDALAWFAHQSGDWGSQSHRAWSVALEAGYQLPRVAGTPWFRGGANVASGDANALDDEHRTFVPLLPTPRIYAQLPFYNGMNIRDLFAHVIVRPHSMITVRADFHELRLREENDLWYSGGGATSERIFGYAGIAAVRGTDLANVAEISVTASPHRRVTLYAFYAYASGGEVMRSVFADADIRYGYFETTLRY
ncbi:MAG: alginate export family protein [bacterium]